MEIYVRFLKCRCQNRYFLLRMLRQARSQDLLVFKTSTKKTANRKNGQCLYTPLFVD